MRVAIVGAGFSGTLLAINLLEQPDVEVLLIERDRHRMGAGVAYSSTETSHLLNVRAGNMSAFADRPDHFCDWLAAHGLGCEAAFVTRATYGRYLRETLRVAMERYGRRLKLVDDEVLDIEEKDGQVTLGLVNGGLIEADRAVLAIGNLPPHDPPAIAGAHLPAHRYIADPWASDFAEGLADDAAVLVVGTGLTAVDVILRLAASGFAGPITALSRRGLRPHRHVDGLPRPKPVLARPAPDLSELVRWARGEAKDRDWRLVVDSSDYPDDVDGCRCRQARAFPAPPAPVLGRSSPPAGARSRRPHRRAGRVGPAAFSRRQDRRGGGGARRAGRGVAPAR